MSAAAAVKDGSRQAVTIEDRIRQRAYELYLQRGNQPGSDTEDWLRAEEEIRRAENDARIDEASQESFPSSDAPAY